MNSFNVTKNVTVSSSFPGLPPLEPGKEPGCTVFENDQNFKNGDGRILTAMKEGIDIIKHHPFKRFCVYPEI